MHVSSTHRNINFSPNLHSFCLPSGTRLAVISGDIIENIYPIRPTSAAAKKAALARIQSRLDMFYAELPECLAYDTTSKRYVPPPHILQMHMTYWNLVMLLHRAL